MKEIKDGAKSVAVVMGSDSDWDVMKKACLILEEFGVNYHKQVLSAHRTPQDMLDFSQQAKERGFSVIIAGAGGAAHLPGMIASATTLPVIGVPIKLKSLDGLDSLLSIVQMPKGVPVAAVAIDNSINAALLAIRILALNDDQLLEKISKYQTEMADESRSKTL